MYKVSKIPDTHLARFHLSTLPKNTMKPSTRAAHGLLLLASLFITITISNNNVANARPQGQHASGLPRHDNVLARRASPIYTIRLNPATTAPTARPAHATISGAALQPRAVLQPHAVLMSPAYERLIPSTSELEMRAEDLSIRKMHRQSAAIFQQLVNVARTAEQQMYYAGRLAVEEGRPHDGLGYFEQAKPWFSSGQADLVPLVQQYMADNLEDDALTLIETCAPEPRSEELCKLKTKLLQRTMTDAQIQEFIKGCGTFPKSLMPLKICFVQRATGADQARRKLVLRAFQAWTVASDGAVSFVETHDQTHANIKIGWRPYIKKADDLGHGHKVLGKTMYHVEEDHHVVGADICLHLMNDARFKFGTDYATCLHEIGHALGIWNHPDKAGSVMIASHSEDVNGLPQMDRRLILALYGRPEAQLATPDQWRAHADLTTSARVRTVD